MSNYKHIFGPVVSRRFGRSLGVDLVPYKTCSLDCVFCQIRHTTDCTVERMEYVPIGEVLCELGAWLAAGGESDFVTLSGSGEPTLHTRFGEVIDFVHDRSRIPVLLLSNGTLLSMPEVREAAARADVVKVSLGAWDQQSFEKLNRPCKGLRFTDVVAGQKQFREEYDTELWMEVVLVPGINAEPDQVERIAMIAAEIGPDCIHLNTAVRPPAESFVKPLPLARMETLAALFDPQATVIGVDSGDAGSKKEMSEHLVVAMLERRPCTKADLIRAFGVTASEMALMLDGLVENGAIATEEKNGERYYVSPAKGLP